MSVIRCSALVLIFCTVAILALPFENEVPGNDAIFDERMAELTPEERFNWKAFKHVPHHLASNLMARNLADEGGAVPEGFDELTPEEKSWWRNLLHRASQTVKGFFRGK
ncbi:hypothetical protein BSL78_15252 [Apostichopus japonicus]|uniref:Uncharacterized protein n=1 Tax=Stichopus japonicus TaxID=307972 RepID=A0A2G8KIS1_STIJA|nr:hypothetical protein BSL78_15252 [Apostichopus japonicus]